MFTIAAISVKSPVAKQKEEIIRRFLNNVKGKKPDTSSYTVKHSGKEGHWLETQMGISHNASNTPDLFGFEMKNGTFSKTTFGDWSADYYIFHNSKYAITRDDFLTIFGKPNPKKDGRYSWSGEPCPKIQGYNSFGQILIVDDDNNIIIQYSFPKDQRRTKEIIVPSIMQQPDLVLAKWNSASLKKKVEQKFNNQGWFQCTKDSNGRYSDIFFGPPINFVHWIEGVKNGLIFFDSGMYHGNARNYSQWRANNKYWDSLRSS